MEIFLFYRNFARLRGRNKHYSVDKSTEIVIEGFPLCGNTFAYTAFILSQNNSLNIAHHIHTPSQIIVASKYKIPTMVLIRKPDDAILSLSIRKPYITIRQGIRAYIHFYKHILPYKNNFIVVPFKELTDNFGRSILRLNNKFATNFLPFIHTEENVEKCFQIIEELDKKDRRKTLVTETTVARPSRIREKIKQDLKNELKNNQQLLNYAYSIYNQYLTYAS